jgi:hypothetical protein
MNFIGKLSDFNISYIDEKAKIILETNEVQSIIEGYESLKKFEELDIEIKVHREKRSLNANAYAWKLITEIANVNRTSKEEVYKEMLKRYGQSDVVSVVSNINVSSYFKYYEEAGTSKLNGKDFTHYRVYKGSSEYDTREMSILIDGVISECKELGIETMTPNELKSLKESWCNE